LHRDVYSCPTGHQATGNSPHPDPPPTLNFKLET
jgi:hypothetical protein